MLTCSMSFMCAWYMNVPGVFGIVNSYTIVSPGMIGGIVKPPTPSIEFGTISPCQWIVDASSRRFV